MATHLSSEGATPARAILSMAVILPAGLMMGFGFPSGMRLVQAIDHRPTPWFWGINGAAGVLASVLAVVLSIAVGIDATIIAGGSCYLALIPAALAMGCGSVQDSHDRVA